MTEFMAKQKLNFCKDWPGMSEDCPIIIYATFPTKGSATKIGHGLVDNKLVAGVNIFGPGASIYQWQSSIREHLEWYLLAQSLKSLFDAVREFIIHHHPYQVPCIIFWEMAGHAPFLDWINEVCVQKNKL